MVLSSEAAPSLDGAAAWARRVAHESDVLARWRAAQPGAAPGWVDRLALAADQFVVRRPLAADPDAMSVIAGYHWFGDWGRDTMVSLPGLCLCTGRAEVARHILTTFARFVDQGMLPNVFPDSGEKPEYNTADAALWYFEAVRAYHAATQDAGLVKELFPVLADMIALAREGHALRHRRGRGRRAPARGRARRAGHVDGRGGRRPGRDAAHGQARRDQCALVQCAPRHELSRAGGGPARCDLGSDGRARRRGLRSLLERGGRRVPRRDRWPAGADPTLRPNQIFAVSLPASPLSPERQRRVVDTCARQLLTSFGLRSLAPGDPAYMGRYGGGSAERDGAYHQGPAWGWLLGPFALAHLRVYGDRQAARAFLAPMAHHLGDYGLGSIAEIFEGDAPFAPRGAIAQAWSVAETLRAWCEIAGRRLGAPGMTVKARRAAGGRALRHRHLRRRRAT